MTASLRRTFKKYQSISDPIFKMEMKIDSDVRLYIKGNCVWSHNHWFTNYEWSDWRTVELIFKEYLDKPLTQINEKPQYDNRINHFPETREHFQLLIEILWACDKRISKQKSLIRGFSIDNQVIQQLLWSRIPN